MADAQIVAEVRLDGREAVRGANTTGKAVREIGTEADGAERSIGRLRAALGAAFAVAVLRRVAEFGREMFNLGAAVEETASKFATVFGPAAKGLDDQLREIARSMGLTQTEARGLAATTGAVVQGMGFGQQASADFSLEIVKLAGDLASFNNVQGGAEAVAKALTSALTGEREQLKQLGIVISEDAVKQRMAQRAAEGHADALTDQGKATATLELITEKAGVAVGDLERTQDSAANTARALAADMREQRDVLAQLLLPAMGVLLSTTAEVVRENDTAGRSFVEKVARGALAAAHAIRSGVQAAAGMVRALVGLGKTAGTVAGSGGPLSAFSYLVEGIIADIEGATERMLQADKALATLGLGFAKMKRFLGMDAADEIKAYTEALENANAQLRELRGGQRRRRNSGGVFGDAFRKELADLENLAATLGTLPEVAGLTADEIEGVGRALSGAAGQAERLTAAQERAVQAIRDLAKEREAGALGLSGLGIASVGPSTGQIIEDERAKRMERLAQERVEMVEMLEDVESRAGKLPEVVADSTVIAMHQVGQAIAGSLGFITGALRAAGQESEAAFAAYKAIAIAQAIVDTYKAANVALASAPPPFGFALAALVTGAGFANVRAIASAKRGSASGAPSGGGSASAGSASGGGSAGYSNGLGTPGSTSAGYYVPGVTGGYASPASAPASMPPVVVENHFHGGADLAVDRIEQQAGRRARTRRSGGGL